MFSKGNLHAHGQKLAAYLITGKKDERAELVELRGFAADNIRDAFIDVNIQAEATRCEKPFFHCYVRLPDDEALNQAQWRYVADRIEQQLGFEGQGRAVAFHHDRRSGETHMHMAWSRIDLADMRAIDPGLYKNKLKEVSRELEIELGLSRIGNERDPSQKTLAPGRNEFEQSRRLGTDLKAIREGIRECWDRSDNGRSFEAALAEKGYILARGDKRDFVVVDPAGGDHALGKRITGATAAEIRKRLADIDRGALPSVEKAQTMQAERARLAALRDISLTVPGSAAVEQPAAPGPEAAKPVLQHAPLDHSGVRDADDIDGRRTQVRNLGHQAEEMRQERGRSAEGAGGMVAQQQDAQRRFARNSEELEARRQERLKMLDEAIRGQGKTAREEEGPAVDRGRSPGLER